MCPSENGTIVALENRRSQNYRKQLCHWKWLMSAFMYVEMSHNKHDVFFDLAEKRIFCCKKKKTHTCSFLCTCEHFWNESTHRSSVCFGSLQSRRSTKTQTHIRKIVLFSIPLDCISDQCIFTNTREKSAFNNPFIISPAPLVQILSKLCFILKWLQISRRV